MSVLLFLIPLALMLGLAGLAAFLWALKHDQFEDLDGAASRILFDDDEERAPLSSAAEEKQTPSARPRPCLRRGDRARLSRRRSHRIKKQTPSSVWPRP